MTINQKLINRAYLSKHDFEESIRFIDELKKTDKATLKEALLISAVIAYARPFSENEEHDQTIKKIPQEKITRPLDSEEKRLHNQLITIRNKAVAHSDFDKKPTRPIVRGKQLIQQSKPYSIFAENIDIDGMESLIKKMTSICEDIICLEQRRL